ncbi:uncharacterized protein LOC125170349 isoform X3 [Prionailurus viverrinus]|uniref:uncharacterized protein LOC125170349 isoform X3 n=1 Tax=Prionailurus viverrinus TaxID=61388 RepID=UPI001FF584B0|nr:uncharacterized protein LOC125170349 isoform X3 [Prionailurus viverrinus]
MTPVIVAKLCGILSNLKIPLQEVRGGDAHLLPYLVTSREASSAAPPGSHPSNLKTPVMSKERNKDNFFFFLIPIPTGMDWEKETLTLAAPSAVGRPHAQDWEHRGRAVPKNRVTHLAEPGQAKSERLKKFEHFMPFQYCSGSSLAQLTSAAAALGSDCPTVVTTEVLGLNSS